MHFTIERARPDDVERICAIERAAVELFRGHVAWSAYSAVSLPTDVVHGLIARGLVWVAVVDDEVVGFVCLDTESTRDAIGIAEIDVLPSHGGKGIGAALLEHACAWAREAGYRRVDLGTLADVPWNAPFYAKHGFVEVDKHAPGFAEALARDRENGFPDHLRVFMSRELAPLTRDDWTLWPAPAKLNLFLRIVGRLPNGYHELQTVFRLLDWGDEVRLRIRKDGVITRPKAIDGVPEDTDLTIRAARLLAETTGTHLGAEIEISKRIPMGGGLGGGSSDAASVLVGLNELWDTGLDEDALAALGLRLGADVPVFIRGRSAWAEGVGEALSPIRLPRRWYVVLDLREHVPTAALFADPELTRNAPRATISAFVSGETADNAFEPVVRARHPRVAAALDWLAGFGHARLSGSGGCVFLETRTHEAALAVASRCPAGFTAHVAAGVDPSPLHVARSRFATGNIVS
ncbi:4-(cytidine 5'-diphospho)-2-C-methyl-D-erythritol kinase [Luteibacter anthropi]|uniref:4-(cytidine 5'-diphospho)-2-C-methyl-D-erythritol kinase n=1 Tax=Luteibacter anthropi TaxID=564369 RepID=UPI0020324F5B|nr:4-(cytidine 5'-diphospho)-2-C-methyl-D-erythritol kinase [Luteibacter anthropi]URX62921.1 4-(cytidine 5'-diphospho)-2-C-methyl-D-erythritol kinase [Luteibacter anthropi]